MGRIISLCRFRKIKVEAGQNIVGCMAWSSRGERRLRIFPQIKRPPSLTCGGELNDFDRTYCIRSSAIVEERTQ